MHELCGIYFNCVKYFNNFKAFGLCSSWSWLIINLQTIEILLYLFNIKSFITQSEYKEKLFVLSQVVTYQTQDFFLDNLLTST